MSVATVVRSGRVGLRAWPGSRPHLVVHDVGVAPTDGPAPDGAWTYHQRGHGGSDHAVGGAYALDHLAVDLLRVLAVVGTAVTVDAAGASGIVAALAAVARPGAISAIVVGPGRGWGGWPVERLVAPSWAPNPYWLDGAGSLGAPSPGDPRRRPGRVDPALGLGPPELLPVEPLGADLAALPCPWSATAAGLHDLLLPAARRVGSVFGTAPDHPTPTEEDP